MENLWPKVPTSACGPSSGLTLTGAVLHTKDFVIWRHIGNENVNKQ